MWNGGPLASTEAAMWAMDVAEAGEQGRVSTNCFSIAQAHGWCCIAHVSHTHHSCSCLLSLC